MIDTSRRAAIVKPFVNHKCPVCGKFDLQYTSKQGYMYGVGPIRMYRVSCNMCGTQGPMSSTMNGADVFWDDMCRLRGELE